MRTIVSSLTVPTVILAAWSLAACTGDDTNAPAPPSYDASTDVTVATDSGGEDSAVPVADAAHDGATTDAADAGPIGPYLLLSYYTDSTYSTTEYSAFDVVSEAVSGGFQFAQYGVNVSANSAPWALEQVNDLVLRMDPTAPWKATSSWKVTEPGPNPGATYFDAISVAEVGTKAYVAGYTNDSIVVLDTSSSVDGGAPTKTISLSQFATDADIDGNLEAIAVVYDASQSKVWVVLGNSNNGDIPASGAYKPCAPGFNPLVVAIDPTTDTVVPNLVYSLHGFGTAFTTQAVAFDSANDRLLIATSGCNDITAEADGGVAVGALQLSDIEAVPLSGADAGASSILLDLSPDAVSALVYVDAHHAFVQTGSGTNAWDPTTSTLGAAITNPPDTFVWDGQHLLGPQTSYLADGGSSIAVVAVDPVDGGVTTLATNPFTPVPPAYGWESVGIWPQP